MVRTGTRSLEEVDRGEEDLTAVALAITVTVLETNQLQNIHSKKLKDGLISKLIITKTGHIPSQFKKINDALPVLCVKKILKPR